MAEIKRRKDQEDRAKMKALQMFEEDRQEQRRKSIMKKLIRPQAVEKAKQPKIKDTETKLMVGLLLGFFRSNNIYFKNS